MSDSLANTWAEIEAEIVEDSPDRPKEPRTELDFVRLLTDKLPPLKTTGPEWFCYQDGYWKPQLADSFLPAALAILPEHGRRIRLARTLIDHVGAAAQVPTDNLKGCARFDDDGQTVLVNCRNGVVRVTADGFAMLPHAPHYGFARQAAASFLPEIDAPLFRRVLGEALPDDGDRQLFQLAVGNFLWPDARFEAALVCYGEAGRGKSTLADPVSAALGAGNVTRLSMTQLCDPKSYSLPQLRFAAVNLGTELTTSDIAESGNFKAIVSGEPVDVRPIYGAPFTMQSACKLWFLANNLPRFKHGTEAELRRMRFLRFDYLPPVKDVTLKPRLAAEVDGVFRFVLEGLQQLFFTSEIPRGGVESRAVHERFKVSNDPVGSFVATHCELAPDARIGTDTLRSAYAEFTTENGLPGTCGDWFLRALFERFTTLKEIRPRVNGERRRMVQGLWLKAVITPENE